MEASLYTIDAEKNKGKCRRNLYDYHHEVHPIPPLILISIGQKNCLVT